MLEYIKANQPKLTKEYEEIIYNDKSNYIEEIRDRWAKDSRVSFVFD
ncbi:hypothetical protein [Orenia metallireducens]|jgi:hypothetical protein|nr:hypothetical protein [Orenia metallireducens]